LKNSFYALFGMHKKPQHTLRCCDHGLIDQFQFDCILLLLSISHTQ